ncbi:MAG: DUF3343 domain-containing protein [Ruminococcus sp.]|nr:DUF3343 domain-containing protein [Ruminococcus sp.]
MVMTVCIAEMPSYTYAVKAERLLRSRGYRCKVVRKDKNSSGGCGFLLHIYGYCLEAAEILERNAVPFKYINDISEGGA